LALEAAQNLRLTLFQGYKLFLSVMFNLNIAPASITNEGTRLNFMNIAEADGNAELIQHVRNEMERPTLEQESDWTLAAQPLVEFVQIINSEVAHTKRTETKANNLLALIRKRNSSIQDVNGVNDVDSDMNTLPMAILQELQTVWTKENREQVAQNYNPLKDLLKSRELGSIIL
jgi:dsDNA-specific endonuclease/ATPase MutS2